MAAIIGAFDKTGTCSRLPMSGPVKRPSGFMSWWRKIRTWKSGRVCSRGGGMAERGEHKLHNYGLETRYHGIRVCRSDRASVDLDTGIMTTKGTTCAGLLLYG